MSGRPDGSWQGPRTPTDVGGAMGQAPWAAGQGTNPPPQLTPNPAALGPPPQPLAEPLQVISTPHTFLVPTKRIASPAAIERFHRSKSGQCFLAFVARLSRDVEGQKLSEDCPLSPVVSAICALLERMQGWVDEIPPVQTPLRYGNPAYRTWHERLEQSASALMEELVPPNLREAIPELAAYFEDSFGNALRIDYGTGHETNFVAWLYCLTSIGVLKPEDNQALVCRVFVKYLDLMRKLQTTYWLEPAGSHGVWGLDDYHFLPFIFGSAQLMGHKYIKPKSIHNEDVLEAYAKEYLYLGAVAFVKKVKKGPLAEHSPMLNDISGVPTWNKVNSGMLKMYKAEVLEKVPIMQHFLFGSLLAWDD